MTELEKAWIAGFFEGEGHARRRNAGGTLVSIAQNEREVLEDIQRLLESVGIRVMGIYKNGERGHSLQLGPALENCWKFFLEIRPYMRHPRKIEQLEDAIAIPYVQRQIVQERVVKAIADRVKQQGMDTIGGRELRRLGLLKKQSG